MKGEKGIAAGPVSEGIGEELADDSFGEWTPARVNQSCLNAGGEVLVA